MIRMTMPDDTEALLAVACASGLFEPHQVVELAGMLNQYFATESTGHELWLIRPMTAGLSVLRMPLRNE